VTCVDKYRLKEATEFVELDCSTISIIANGTTEARRTPRMKTPITWEDLVTGQLSRWLLAF